MSTVFGHPRIYANVQGVRALAALAVVAYHIGALPFGQCGVDMFFVISGFIMSHVAPSERQDFFRKRLIRIVPLYWLSTIGVYAIATLKPMWLNTTTAGVGYLVRSLLFLPYVKADGHWGPLNLNGWTLEYEMLFYLVVAFALTLTRPRFATTFAAVSLAAYSLANAFIKPSNLIVDYLGQPFLLEFGLGVLSYWAVQSPHAQRVSSWRWLVLGCASLVVVPVYFKLCGAPSGMTRIVVYGVPAFIFTTSMIAMDMAGWTVRSRFVARLGAASYAIYLLHPYVTGVLRKVLTIQTDLGSLKGVATVLVVMAIVCAVGDMCHFLFERPMLAYLNGWFRQTRTTGVRST